MLFKFHFERVDNFYRPSVLYARASLCGGDGAFGCDLTYERAHGRGHAVFLIILEYLPGLALQVAQFKLAGAVAIPDYLVCGLGLFLILEILEHIRPIHLPYGTVGISGVLYRFLLLWRLRSD